MNREDINSAGENAGWQLVMDLCLPPVAAELPLLESRLCKTELSEDLET